MKFPKREWYHQIILPGILLILLITSINVYKKTGENKVELAVAEHAGLLAEPFWNFDMERAQKFLEIFIARPEYQDIQLLGSDGELLAKSQSDPLNGVEQFFKKLNLIKIHRFSSDIVMEDELLGKLVVSWRDRSVYVAANALLVTLLIYIITFLYSSVAKTNRRLVEKVDDLHLAFEEVQLQKNYIENIFNVVPEGLITIGNNQKAITWNLSYDQIVATWADRLNMNTTQVHEHFMDRLLESLQENDAGEYSIHVGDECINISYASSEILGQDKIEQLVSLIDVTEMRVMQQRLSHAEKLESVGRLASGIAHEINTPTQYVISNIDFLTEGFEDLRNALKKITKKTGNLNELDNKVTAHEIETLLEDADWEYLEKEIPHALSQSSEGLSRIKSIISAMKQFSHPSGKVAERYNINQAIKTTVTVATNEWKYCADVELALADDLPDVYCFLDQLNQVVLNMIINAAHAIAARLEISGDSRGKITISTREKDNYIECCIRDDGIGMTDEVRQKIFDPFFTTKEVNKGSGQGLAIANDIIVTQHKGQIEVASKEMEGTSFTIRLPLKPNGTED